MTVEAIIKFIESWAPKGAAFEKDNPGLQVGDSKRDVKGVFLCLELTEKALLEAERQSCDFIFTHHPFIFQPLKRINLTNDPKASLLEKLIKKEITLYSAHTNLDFTKEGVSFQLARELGLKNIRFLENQSSNQFKVTVFIPKDSADKVAEAMFSAGGGVIGEYSKCSFRTDGTGSFLGSENSNPAVGKAMSFEKAEETRLELIADSWNLNGIIKAMIKAHPYEEPAYDIYPLKNLNVNYGYGALGDLDEELSIDGFLKLTAGKLHTKTLKYVKGKHGRVKSVAVCGGSGADLLSHAINSGADAFVTADVKYHAFFDADGVITLIDAGHYETEAPALKEVKKRLDHFIKINNENIKTHIFSESTNPIKHYIYQGEI